MLRKKTEYYKRKKQISQCSPASKSLVEALNGPSWSYYSGTLDGASVVVTCSGDMNFLFRMGFFGKGSLSRSYPGFSEQKQKSFLRKPSSSETENDFKSQNFIMAKRKWLPCLEKDPCPVKESLLLTLEEAFFLSYGLGCLCVTNCNQKKLSLTEMWHKFQELKDQFIPHYVVYHYFRSKGWVPKSGLKFGCDFILYRDGPPFYHGSYSVLVMTVKDRNILPHLKNDGHYFDQYMRNWADLFGVNRVVDQVAKTLMLCYVIWPEDELNDGDLFSPKCLVKFKVKEVIVSRWVPSQESI